MTPAYPLQQGIAMTITRDDIAKVALLARLELNADELATMTEHLSNIVEYVDQLSQLNTDTVEPMAHPADVTNVLVDDTRRDSLPRDRALQNAPHSDGECYLVPAVLGE